MRFITATASALLAMATSAIAQTPDFNPIYTPAEFEEVPAGAPFEVTWSAPDGYTDGTVSISLIGGASQNTLVPLGEIATGVPNSAETYSWSVDASLGADALYGLVFRYESRPEVFQYSQPFYIKAGSSEGGETATEDAPVVTKTAGIKTVTLSSCPPTETSTTAVWTTSIVTPNSTVSASVTVTSHYNTSTSIVHPTYTSTFVLPTLPPAPSPEVPEVTTAPAPVPIPSEVPVGAAGRFTAGPLALVGGAVVAALLL